MSLSKKKGFTLIELLIVIAILVILAVVVILTLNPAQLLAQARDSQRMSDMSTLKSAIALYLADVTNASSLMGTSTNCYSSATVLGTSTDCYARYPNSSTTFTTGVVTSTSPTKTDGTGWIPINFNSISSGSPLGAEPIDPSNNGCSAATLNTSTCYMYTYALGSTAGQYKMTAHMESTRYAYNGGNDVESKDGGTNPYAYEVGTTLTL